MVQRAGEAPLCSTSSTGILRVLLGALPALIMWYVLPSKICTLDLAGISTLSLAQLLPE